MRLRSASRSAATVAIALLVVFATVGAFAGTGGAQSSSKADVVFVFDKTGSMNEQADALKDEVENVANELDASGIDARYGLMTYESASNSEIRQELTYDTDVLKDALGFSTEGGTEDASDAILMSLDEFEYRDDARKIIVVITDEDDDSSSTTRDTAIDRLNSEEACLVSVSPDVDDSDELKTMAEERADCGEWTDINSESFTDVVRDLIDVIEDVTGPDFQGPGGPDFEVVERSVDIESTDGSGSTGGVETHVGEPVTVTVEVENEGSPGTYHALLTTATESLGSKRADIGHGESHTFEWTLTFDEPTSTALFVNYRSAGHVEVVERPPDPLAAEDVEVTDAYVTRSTVWGGETYEVVAEVENVGNESGLATVEYATGEAGANNTTVAATDEVVLEPNETAERRHTVTVAEDPAGELTRTWTVDGEPAGNVTVLSTAAFATGVVDAYPATPDVDPGESYEVGAVVHNAGAEDRLFFLHWAEDGQRDGFSMVYLEAGETAEVTRTAVAPDTGGAVSWSVNGVSTTVQVTDDG